MRMKTSDEALALAALQGDRDAFARLLERHYDRIFRLSFRLTGSRADAEDLTQDICANLANKLRGFRNEARFTTWLYRVVVNAVHDRRRRATSYAKASDGWGVWEENRQAVSREAQENQTWLRTAMTALNHDLRDTMALLLDEDMTHKQAADVLDVSEGTVSWRVAEVKKKLRQHAKTEAEV